MGISTSPTGRPRVLVLLLVLLVAAPMLASHAVEVPAREAALGPITVAVHGDGRVSIEADGRETTVLLVDLAATVRPMLDAHPGRLIVLDVEGELPYQIAVDTIDTLKSAGGGRVALARQ